MLQVWASHLRLFSSSHFLPWSFYRRTLTFQTDLCSQPQTSSCQHLAHSYHRIHCSLPPRSLPCLSSTFPFTLWSRLCSRKCAVLSGDWAMCELQGAPALSIPLWEVCVLQPSAPGPPGSCAWTRRRGRWAWGWVGGGQRCTERRPGREPAVRSCSHMRKGDSEQLSRRGQRGSRIQPVFYDEAHSSGSVWLRSFKVRV